MRLRFAFLSMVLTAGAAADVPPAQRAEVEHLEAFLEESDCVMIRNGERHDGVDAAEHVRRKYEHFRDRIDSTEAFIARAATKSLVSGRAYRVECPGEATVNSADWLLEELAAYRRRP